MKTETGEARTLKTEAREAGTVWQCEDRDRGSRDTEDRGKGSRDGVAV